MRTIERDDYPKRPNVWRMKFTLVAQDKQMGKDVLSTRYYFHDI